MAGFLNNRHYLPAYGVFASVDPIARPTNPATLNPYVYSRANPITLRDPNGLEPRCSQYARTCWEANRKLLSESRQRAIGMPVSGADWVAFLETRDENPMASMMWEALDVGHEGEISEVDGNVSTKDPRDLRGRDRAESIAAQQMAEMNGGPEINDAEYVAMLTDMAGTLHGSDEVWEDIDDEIGWYEQGVVGLVHRNWRSISFYGGALACIAASFGTCAGAAIGLFALRSGATVYSQGFRDGDWGTVAATVGLDAGMTGVGLMTGSMTNDMIAAVPASATMSTAGRIFVDRAPGAIMAGFDIACASACPTSIE